MSQLPTKEQDEHWTGNGLWFDSTKLRVECGPADENGNRLVIASLYGVTHRDCFNTDIAWKRQKFREKCYDVFGVEDENIHEAIETAIIAKADAADLRADGTSIYRPVVTMLSTVPPAKVEWLWPNRLAIGKNNLLSGDPGLGKSLCALDVAARVSRGEPFPDGGEGCEPGGVVILTMEDDAADTLVPRLLAHNADLSRIAHVSGMTETNGDGQVIHGIDLGQDLEAVRTAIQQVKNCKLVIVDTISDYIGSKSDLHKNRDVRAVLNPMAAMANEFRVANLCISHLRKGEGRAIHASMGSVGFVGQCRVAWAITRCPTNPRRRLMTCIKNNLADDTSGLAYAIESHGADGGPVLCWEAEPVRMSADQAMSQLHQPRGRKPTERVSAEDWLAKYLADAAKPAANVLDDAEAAGHKPWTIRRAFTHIECRRWKDGFEDGWIWALPEDDSEDNTEAGHTDICNLPHLRENTEENTPQKRALNTLPAKVTNCLSPVLPLRNGSNGQAF